MPELKSLDTIYLVLGFLVPGLVMIFVRAQFTTGRIAPHKDAVLTYLSLSVIYYAAVLPLLDHVIRIPPGYGRALGWFAIIFAGPTLVGAALGFNAKKGITRSLFEQIFKIQLVHSMPTAWDWKFAQGSAEWVLVTLKNGIRFAGWLSRSSFVSSDVDERDIYIEKVYELDEDDKWVDGGLQGVLVTAGEISTIQFWPDKKDEGIG